MARSAAIIAPSQMFSRWRLNRLYRLRSLHFVSAQPTIVFVSHSSRDGETANVFVQHLLKQADLRPNVSVRFTSARQTDSPALLDPGTAIWKQLRVDLKKTKCFIACLSEDFFKSSWCVAELTIFHELSQSSRQNALKRKLIVLIVDPSARNLTTNFLTQGLAFSVIWSAIDLERLGHILAEWEIRNLPPIDEELQKLRSEARAAVRSRTQAKKGYITEIAQQHLGFPSSTNGPITCLVRRDEYEQISINMARRARSELLWTLFKSPLLVADAFRQPDRLMPYDRHFRDFDPVNKVRLVIFEDIPMAQAYAECNLSYHKERFDALGATDINVTEILLGERKKQFEESACDNDGRLFFTTLDRLLLLFPPLTRPEPFTAESFLEFAYADSEEVPGHRLILDSGFTSEFSRRHATGKRHDKTALQFRYVTFYVEPGTDCAICVDAMTLYKNVYGHINDLRVIATTLFSTLEPDPKIFVTLSNIHNLWEGPP